MTRLLKIRPSARCRPTMIWDFFISLPTKQSSFLKIPCDFLFSIIKVCGNADFDYSEFDFHISKCELHQYEEFRDTCFRQL